MGSVHGTNAAEEHGIRRSPHWPTVEKHFLASNPRCAACSDEQEKARGGTRGLQVHHAIMPFHFCILLGRPDLELDPRNLLVLCEDEAGVVTQDHHLLLGHLRDFRSYMPDAKSACARWFGKSKAEILADVGYVSSTTARPQAWAMLSDEEKKSMRTLLDAKLPRL